MALLLSDAFNRADSTVSPGTPDSGGPYTVQVGTFGISSNRLYAPASTANAHLTFPAAIDVDLQVTHAVSNFNSAGLIFRWINSTNYWWFNANSSAQYSLRRLNAGSETTVVGLLPLPAANDVMRVIAKGAYIHLYINGNHQASVEDHWYSGATTTCGVRISSNTSGRWDDLTANDAPTTIPDSPDGTTVDIPANSLLYHADTNILDSWVYKGRNTKTQDTGAMA